MTANENIPWKQLSVEAAAIVGSILLAFAIDAWWEDKQKGSEERIVLQALFDDLNQKKVTLTRASNTTDVILKSASALLQASSDTSQNLSGDSIDKLIGNLLWYQDESYWESAPMNSVFQGGESSQLSNPQLVQKLASLQVTMDRMKNTAQADKKVHHEILAPYLMQNANLVQIAMTWENPPSGVSADYSIPDVNISMPRDHTELLSKEDFQGLLILKMDHHINMTVLTYPRLAAELDEAINILERELAH